MRRVQKGSKNRRFSFRALCTSEKWWRRMGSDKDESWWIAFGEHALLFTRTFFTNMKNWSNWGKCAKAIFEKSNKAKICKLHLKKKFDWLMAQNLIKSKINFQDDAREISFTVGKIMPILHDRGHTTWRDDRDWSEHQIYHSYPVFFTSLWKWRHNEVVRGTNKIL